MASALISPEDIFKKAEQGKLPSCLVLRGDNPYFARELRRLIRKSGCEVLERELKKTGPDGAAEDVAGGMSLFRTRQVVWLKATSLPTAWSKEGASAWKRLTAAADGDSLFLILHADADKRVKWENQGAEAIVDFKVEAAATLPWIKRMNEARGGFLSAEKIRFLNSLEAELMILDNWIELWSMGGDLWAERSIGWGQAASAPVASGGGGFSSNPVFGWVDAVLAGRKRDSAKLLLKLLDDGEEPRQIISLLAKSVRILAQLECGKMPRGQPDFLIQKLQRLKGSLKPGHARRLLKATAEADRLLKSSSAKPAALLLRL